ncbi:hypothetical protein BHM03_00035764 [Ensete ventricosum]|nr:hypothetical protein BHM03_00035764 [Ensete ventricosum]
MGTRHEQRLGPGVGGWGVMGLGWVFETRYHRNRRRLRREILGSGGRVTWSKWRWATGLVSKSDGRWPHVEVHVDDINSRELTRPLRIRRDRFRPRRKVRGGHRLAYRNRLDASLLGKDMGQADGREIFRAMEEGKRGYILPHDHLFPIVDAVIYESSFGDHMAFDREFRRWSGDLIP